MDFDSIFRTILPTGSAVPAIFRIFQVGNAIILGGFHVNCIGRADGIAQTATGTFIHVENRRHFLSSWKRRLKIGFRAIRNWSAQTNIKVHLLVFSQPPVRTSSYYRCPESPAGGGKAYSGFRFEKAPRGPSLFQ